MTVLHHALCGDDFHQTPVSKTFREKSFFFFWFCGRCNIGVLGYTRSVTSARQPQQHGKNEKTYELFSILVSKKRFPQAINPRSNSSRAGLQPSTTLRESFLGLFPGFIKRSVELYVERSCTSTVISDNLVNFILIRAPSLLYQGCTY